MLQNTSADGFANLQSIANILIVDDLPENLLALDALIRKSGRLIFQASSGDEALELLLTHEFALAILDVQMPGMNGFELAELMRSTERTRHIPIVFVTAAGRESNYAFSGYESGAVDFLYKPLDTDAVRGKVRVFVDLYHQQQEIQQQLSALQKSRQAQARLLEELQGMQTQLQHAVRLRDDFMSMVAHELRTPLNTLSLESQMRKKQLERGQVAIFNATYLKAMVERDRRQISSMVRLIDDMMDVTRLRTQGLSVRCAEVELVALLRGVLETLAGQASAAGSELTLEAPEPIPAWLDAFRIEQVVVNLLTNALRYGGGKPISVRLARLEGGWARIQVADQGMGIKEADQERIFDQFERVTLGDGIGGLGLGLFITRQLVSAHGGTIHVQSRVGEGSTFEVRLPVQLPAPVSSPIE